MVDHSAWSYFRRLHIREWFGLIDEGVRLFQNPWGSPLFGATFFSITGLHLLHVICGVVAFDCDLARFSRGWLTAATLRLPDSTAFRRSGLDVCRALIYLLNISR